ITERVRARDTTGELLERLSVAGSQLLLATLDGLQDGTIDARPQSTDGVSMAGKVTTADARIDWSAPAIAIDRLVRSVTPEPGAWTESPWGRMVVGPVELTDRNGLAPGELAIGKTEVLLGTGSHAVRLGSLTPPGRRPMPAADWARGVRPGAGTVLS
ncbi:MAG: methionyl-tRNA formyltransferase, partial [Nakamurella sp.]